MIKTMINRYLLGSPEREREEGTAEDAHFNCSLLKLLQDAWNRRRSELFPHLTT